jgi:hypothetical protein
MTEADPDEIGPDGTVRLRCYLTMADSGAARPSAGSTTTLPLLGRAARWISPGSPDQPSRSKSKAEQAEMACSGLETGRAARQAKAF